MEHDTPIEPFVKFLPNQGHKAKEIFDELMKFPHGQSYNASAMSGRYNGLQSKVAAEYHHAAWIPCNGLNVVKQLWHCFTFLNQSICFFSSVLTHRIRSHNGAKKVFYNMMVLSSRCCKSTRPRISPNP